MTLVERLRAADCAGSVYTMMCEAADRIDALENQLDEDIQLSVSRYKRIQELTAEVSRLKTSLDEYVRLDRAGLVARDDSRHEDSQ